MTDRTETLRETREHEAVGDGGSPGVVVLYSEAPIAGDAVYRVGRELLIGRSPERGIFLPDGAMSRAHAALRKRDNRLVLEDLDSRNGSYVNRMRVDGKTPLASGDVLRCGSTLFLAVGDTAAFKGWRKPKGLTTHGMLGGPAIVRLRRELQAFSSSSLEILLLGESGTGKELAAREIHSLSRRRGEFVAINCAAIPEALFESEIFGVARGAYTGAERDRAGAFRRAHKGTLFLDELAELPSSQQAKLLRAVEQQQVLAVGATAPYSVDVRLVAATHGNLLVRVEQGCFRADLYHRLRGAVVRLPPLREHREDIPLLVERALHRSQSKTSTAEVSVAVSAMEALLCYGWPGNVRELLRCVEEAQLRAVAEGSSVLAVRHLRDELRLQVTDEPLVQLKRALRAHGGNVSRVAEALSMHRARIYTLLREHGLSAQDFRTGGEIPELGGHQP